jgi:sodium/hydrogen exchanger-like protein 6/7
LAEPDTAQKEILSSWALFILIMLLIVALFASYLLQHKKIQAVHETVISIFAGSDLETMMNLPYLIYLGMIAGLIIKLTEGTFIQSTVSFNEGFFFNLLLPPIILASGYELHQVRRISRCWHQPNSNQDAGQFFS